MTLRTPVPITGSKFAEAVELSTCRSTRDKKPAIKKACGYIAECDKLKRGALQLITAGFNRRKRFTAPRVSIF